jgi:translation initiation factor 1
MISSTDQFSIIFISAQSPPLADIAREIFSSVAASSNFDCQAQSLDCTEEISLTNKGAFNSAKSIIVIGESAQLNQPQLLDCLKQLNDKVEFWTVPATLDLPAARSYLEAQSKQAIVRLILKNGKRPAGTAGTNCPKCRYPLARCTCPKVVPESNKKVEFVKVSLDRKARGGKTVTVITGFSLSEEDLIELGAKLKKRCGSGGTVKDGVIEIQGDHRDRMLKDLAEMGYKCKRVGG